jgi:hypothetical protein
LELIQDNNTRWNSHYDSICRGLELHKAIDEYIIKNQENLKDDALSEAEWKQLQDICTILEPFKIHTIHMQGCNASLIHTLPTMELLLGKLEKSKNTFKNHPLAININNAWIKFDKYYSRTEQSPVYVVAIVLDPRHKWDFFNLSAEWKPAWIQQAEQAVQDLWDEYKQQSIENTVSAASLPNMLPPNISTKKSFALYQTAELELQDYMFNK